MLVLTRKKNEILEIGQGICIKVIRVSGNKVRLGISAPRDFQVKRTELAQPSSIPNADSSATNSLLPNQQ